METRHITTLEELSLIAKEVLLSCLLKDGANVITLSGDLGAGKTAFTKELAKLLKIQQEITSPTFVIMKTYSVQGHAFIKSLTHIDAYRIEADEEMRVLGFSQLCKDPSKLICIEWPEKIQNLIPQDAYKIIFTLNNDGSRDVMFGT